jgi:hypothetical protein
MFSRGLAEVHLQEQRCRGSEVQRFIGAEILQRGAAAVVQRQRSAEVKQCRGAGRGVEFQQRCRGAECRGKI